MKNTCILEEIKLIRKAGAYKVSEGAAKVLAYHLEALAIDITREAIMLASHAERKTVKAEDIKLAQKRLFG